MYRALNYIRMCETRLASAAVPGGVMQLARVFICTLLLYSTLRVAGTVANPRIVIQPYALHSSETNFK